jgi:hypothetical protein
MRPRPKGVWVVSSFYVISVGWTLLSFALVFSGAIKLTGEQEAYLTSLTGVDWFFTFATGVVTLSAAISLFLLRRIAVTLFAVALALNVAVSTYYVMRTNWITAIGGAGSVGTLLGLLILVTVTLYARRLSKRGVLS